jgi:hypothetical protein
MHDSTFVGGRVGTSDNTFSGFAQSTRNRIVGVEFRGLDKPQTAPAIDIFHITADLLIFNNSLFSVINLSYLRFTSFPSSIIFFQFGLFAFSRTFGFAF